MIIVIFFGGLVTGFIIGWISLALLTTANRKNREEEQDLLYNELSHPPPGSG